MKIIFAEIAVKELLQARSFYEVEVAGLGEKFSNEIKNALKRISNFPTACPILKNEIRKCVVKKFPYNLLYSIEQDFILITIRPNHSIWFSVLIVI